MNHSAHRRNWKSLGLILGLLSCCAGTLSAQNCEAIVLPMLNNDANQLAMFPADKIAFHCAFSYYSFQVSDTLASAAPLHDISEVKDLLTGEQVSSDVNIDLDVLSYYRYDFNRFQIMHPEVPIYFHTRSSSHPYLVLVPVRVAEQRAQEKMDQGY